MDVLGDSSLFAGNGEISTKDLLKRIGDRSASGPRQYDTELVNRQDNIRPTATRVDTDPGVWHQERSVRPVQEPPTAYVPGQGTPPQKWRNPDYPNQYDNENISTMPENGQRREWRNSGWGRPNNSVPAGTG
jgi:hypothetical protein